MPDGVRPSLLVTGSLHDPRVLIHEPAKWVARLRATAAPGGRLLFRPELGVGAHVGPAGRYDQVRYEAEILAFIWTRLASRRPERPGVRRPGMQSRGRSHAERSQPYPIDLMRHLVTFILYAAS